MNLINNKRNEICAFRHLLVMAFCLLTVTVVAQNSVTLNVENSSIRSVFEMIEKQSGYSIAYNQSELNVGRQIDVKLTNRDIASVMKEVLKDTGFGFKIEGRHIIILLQTKMPRNEFVEITGRVTDASGQSVIGANISIQGAAIGTISDFDGHFTLEVPEGAVLNVTYIGYLPYKFEIKDKRDYSITLKEDTKNLEEVVVVGYGTQKKVNVIGSVVQISADKLENRSVPMLANALTGQMSGVTVIQRTGKPGRNADGTSNTTLRVRGVGSFGAKSDALVLIDGLPGDLNDVNPENVLNVSVLKDASTAAIYGSRAANGVVLVTTKSGKEGKISISYNGYVGANMPTSFPDMVNSWEYAALYNEASGKEVYSAEAIQKYKDGSDRSLYPNSNMLKEVFSRNGIQTGHDLTLTGGTNTNKYYFTFGYLDQNGVVEKNNFSRYSARVNLTNELAKGLTLTTRLSGISSMQKEPSVPGGKEDAKGLEGITIMSVRYPSTFGTKLPNGDFGVGPESSGTPVAWINSQSFYESPRFLINTNVRLDYTPVKDLILSAIGGYNYSMEEQKRFYSTLRLNDNITMGPSMLKEEHRKTVYKTFQALAEYNKDFKGHAVGIMAGYSWEEESFRNLTSSRDKFPGNDLPFLDAGSPDNQKAGGGGYDWAIQSLFGRFKYNYLQKYLMEATVRYDGSSRFPSSKKFGVFPSVAGGWRVSEEHFLKDRFSWLDNLKIKASWGKLGNQEIGNYPYQPVYNLGENYPFGMNYQPGAALTTLTDTNLHWEETQTTDVGIETTFLKGLLSVNVLYFYRKTYDILYKPNSSISSVLGLELSERNTGQLQNTGWEIEMGHQNTVGNVHYNISANMSIIKNKVLDLGLGNVTQLNGLVGNGNDLFIGHPMEMYYGYQTDGLFVDETDVTSWYNQTKVNPKAKPGDIRYKDISGPNGVPDGQVDPNYDRVILGSRIPKFTFGLNLGAEYKGFDFAMQLQGVAGVKGLLDGYAGWAFRQEGNVQRWQADGRWTTSNPQRYATYPRLEIISSGGSPNTVQSDFWVIDASYLRLRSIQLGYTLPKQLLTGAKISNLRFYVSSENPLCWNKYRKGWDPEINSGGEYYPILAVYTFGVNLKF